VDYEKREPMISIEASFALAMLYFEFIEAMTGNTKPMAMVGRGPLMEMVNYIRVNSAYYITEFMEDILTTPEKLAKVECRYNALTIYRDFMRIYEEPDMETAATEYITQWDFFNNDSDAEEFECRIGLREKHVESDVLEEIDPELDLS
jgi:hypothetical protein